jgi:hypothetical protein
LGEDSLAKNTAIYLEILADRIRRSHSKVPFELVERSISADPELHPGEWIAVEHALRPRLVNSTWRGDVKRALRICEFLGITIGSSSNGRYGHGLAELARLLRIRRRILTMRERFPGEL